MSPRSPQPPTGLFERLALIFAGLRGAIALHMNKDRTNLPALFLAWRRLGRLAERLQALIADLRDGVIPPRPRPREPAYSHTPRAPGGGMAMRTPTRPGWLLALAAPEAPNYAGQLQSLLAEPETQALLAQAPEAAARILRPLCRMLGIEANPQLANSQPPPPPPETPAGRLAEPPPKDQAAEAVAPWPPSPAEPDASATGPPPNRV
jgi:hypothetical protein